MNAPRSGCPINLTLEALGDRWSLIVIRDLMFGNRRHFRELLLHRLKPLATWCTTVAVPMYYPPSPTRREDRRWPISSFCSRSIRASPASP